jgi:hypothetical protein
MKRAGGLAIVGPLSDHLGSTRTRTTRGLIVTGMIRVRSGLIRPWWDHDGMSRRRRARVTADEDNESGEVFGIERDAGQSAGRMV